MIQKLLKWITRDLDCSPLVKKLDEYSKMECGRIYDPNIQSGTIHDWKKVKEDIKRMLG